MNIPKISLNALGLGIILLNLTSCNSPTPQTPNSPPPPVSHSLVTPNPKPPSNPNTIPVTVYKPDRQCNTLIPEQITVSQTNPLRATIGQVIQDQNTPEFEMAGYRIQIDSSQQVATIDLRVSPNSKRQLVSLSSCEQLSLFGSLRKTLTENSQWKIKEVRFTERGQEIIL